MVDKREVLKNDTYIGAYIVKQLIGSGGTGNTYKAISSSGKIVVIKEIFPLDLAEKDIIYRTDDGRVLFSDNVDEEYIKAVKEKIKQSINREIENINQAKYDYETLGTSEEVFYAEELEKDNVLENELAMYIVMETGDGCSLKEYLDEIKDEKGKLIYYILIIKQLIAALDNMYPVVHLDLKPSNIFVRKSEDDMRLTILDFGSSVNVDNLKSILGSISENKTDRIKNDSGNNIEKILEIFNPSYSMGFAAPEMVSCIEAYSNCNDGNFIYYVSRIDQRSDFYSVGAILYYMLTSQKYVVDELGENDFDEEIRNVDALKGYPSECVDKILIFLKMALAYDVNERYTNYEDAKCDIKNIFDFVGGTDIRKSIGDGNTRVYTREHVIEAKRQSRDESEKKKSIRPISASTNDNTYIERTELVEALRNRIENIASIKKILFITGMGGIGKSELARSYANNYYGGDNTNNKYKLYARELLLTYPEDKIVGINELLEDHGYDYYINKYTEFGSDTLIIIDNFNIDITSKCDEEARKVEDFLEDICNNTGEAHIIFTSRLNIYTEYDTFDIEDKVTLEFACQVFESNYKKNINENEMAAVEEICKTVSYIDANGEVIGCNLLAISLIAKQLRNQKHTTIIEFNKTIQSGIKAAVDEDFIQTYHNKRYQEYTVYEILFDVIFEKLLLLRSSSKKGNSSEKGDFKPIEKDVLRVMSCCPAQEKDMDTICRIVYGDGAVAWREIKRTTKLLCDLGWVKLIEGDEDEHKRISVHPLVVEFFREKYKKNDGEAEQYLRLAKNVFCLENEKISNEQALITKLWNSSGVNIYDDDCFDNFEDKKYQLLYMSFYSTSKSKVVFHSLYSDVKEAITFTVYKANKKIYGYVSMDSLEETIILDLHIKEHCDDGIELLKIIDNYEKFKLVIPDTIMGYEVDVIPRNFAIKNEQLKSVKLSKYTRIISDNAFYHCQALEDVSDFPDKLEEIGNNVFKWCENMHTNMVLPSNLRKIGCSAFSQCRSLRGVLLIPKGISEILDYTFSGCSSLIALSIPEGVLKIHDGAFEGCEGFTDLKLPQSVSEIGKKAFSRCRGLKNELMFPPNLEEINEEIFYECVGLTGSLKFHENIKRIHKSAFLRCSGLNGTLEFGDNIEYIGETAFAFCNKIKGGLCFKNKVINIEKGAFCGCSSLDGKVTLSKNLDAIKELVFAYCSNLKGDLEIPFNVTRIEKGAFYECNSLEELIMYDNIQVIEDNAFDNCHLLRWNVNNMPLKIEYIGDSAFTNCVSLYGKLCLRDSIKYIGQTAFRGCVNIYGEIGNLSNIEIKPLAFVGCFNICSKIKISDEHGVAENQLLPFIGTTINIVSDDYEKKCIFDNIKNVLEKEFEEYIPQKTKAEIGSSQLLKTGKLKLSETLREIEPFAYTNRLDIAYKIKFPPRLRKIGRNAFMGCLNMSGDLTLPKDTVTNIGEFAFAKCMKLEGTLILPDKLKDLETGVFACCIGLKKVIFPKGLIQIWNRVFENCVGLSGTLDFPPGLIGIGDKAFYGCSGFDGSLQFYDEIVFIGESAFENCNGFVGDLKLPSKLKVINKFVFKNCCSFNGKLLLPDEVKKIYTGAFLGCKNIKKIELREDLEEIGESCFEDCESVCGELIITKNVYSIGAYAFKGCSSIEGLKFKTNKINIINNGTFHSCFNLRGMLKLPDNINTICQFAFWCCYNLTTLELPEQLEVIERFAFFCCKGLTGELKLPQYINRIDGAAFCGCNFEYILFPNKKIDIDVGAFDNTVTFIVHPHSPAEEYAREHGYEYIYYENYISCEL